MYVCMYVVIYLCKRKANASPRALFQRSLSVTIKLFATYACVAWHQSSTSQAQVKHQSSCCWQLLWLKLSGGDPSPSFVCDLRLASMSAETLPSETMTDSDTETLPAEAWEIQASLRNLKEQEEEKEKGKKKEQEALAARLQCHMEQEALAARLQRHNYDDRHFMTFMTGWTTRMRFVQQREHARNLF